MKIEINEDDIVRLLKTWVENEPNPERPVLQPLDNHHDPISARQLLQEVENKTELGRTQLEALAKGYLMAALSASIKGKRNETSLK